MPVAHFVAKTTDLQDGQIKQVEVAGEKILLSRIAGSFHAVSATCPHYGGPLHEGVLCGHVVRCPWHQGRFDVTTGQLLTPPPLDNLRRYDLRVEGEDIFITLPIDEHAPPAAPTQSTDGRTFVILGAGAAGLTAAQTLREENFTGKILLISSENHPPYDRPALSKNYLAGLPLDHPLPLHPPDFFKQHRIERLARGATAVDPAARAISFDDGSKLTYEALLLATGAAPKRLTLPGSDAANIFTLRSLDDADRILAALQGAKRAVLIGSGFIGLEVAACLRQRGLDVTILTPEPVPFARILGPDVGKVFQTLHESHGNHFRFNAKVTAFDASAGRATAAVLADGTRIEADLFLVAVGVQPVTGYLRNVPLNEDASITVDAHLRVPGHPNLFAAGDLARYPDPRTGRPVRIEHWRVAEQLGQLAARNMLGQNRVFDDVPYFWTFQFDFGLDYVGHAEKWDRILIQGDLAKADFAAYYVAGNAILACASAGRSTQMGALADLMRHNQAPTAQQIESAPPDFQKLLEKIPA